MTGPDAMRWDDLRCLLALARQETVARAAEDLGVHPATVYRRLQALEEALGTSLMRADAAGRYMPTEAGGVALHHAVQVEEETLALTREVTGRQAAVAGSIVLTLPESLLPVVCPVLVAFRRRHPRVVLELELGDRMFDLRRREADVALRPSLHPPEDAVGRRIAGVAWTAYTATDEEVPWLGYTETLGDLAATQWWAKNHGTEAVAMAVSTVPAMAQMVATGLGRALLPCFTGDLHPSLRRLHDPPPEAASALWLLIHADLRRNARVRAFVDFAVEELRALTPIFEGVSA